MKRYYKRVFYITGEKRCPVRVSVRLPTGSCRGGCWFCCSKFWTGYKGHSLRQELTENEFLEVWKNAFSGNWLGIWLQEEVKRAVEGQGWLRFVREDLFEPTINRITKEVLSSCHRSGCGLLVKTSRIAVFQWFEELKEIKHHIVFDISPLLEDWREKVKIVNFLVNEGLRVALGLAPICAFTPEVAEILETIDRRIVGVWVGWLHGSAHWFPPSALKSVPRRFVHSERQYNIGYLAEIVRKIEEITSKRGLPLNFYFTSAFHRAGSCCFVGSKQ